MPSQQLLVLVTLMLSLSEIVLAAPMPVRSQRKIGVPGGFFKPLLRKDGKYQGSGHISRPRERSSDFKKLRKRDIAAEAAIPGLPGYINIQASEYNSTSTVVIGNLVLSIDNSTQLAGDLPKSFALDASVTQSTQVWMAPYNMTDTSLNASTDRASISGLQFAPHTFNGETLLPVSLRLPIYQSALNATALFCASFPAFAQVKSTLTIRACQNATSGGVDAEGYSQMFWYDPISGAVRPNWNATASSMESAQSLPEYSPTSSPVVLASWTSASSTQTSPVSSVQTAATTSAQPVATFVPDKLLLEALALASSSATSIPVYRRQVTETHTVTLVNLDSTTTLSSTATVTMTPSTATITQAVTVPVQALEYVTVTAWWTSIPSSFPMDGTGDSALTGFWPETAVTAIEAFPTALISAMETEPIALLEAMEGYSTSSPASALNDTATINAGTPAASATQQRAQNLTLIFKPVSDIARAALASGTYTLSPADAMDAQQAASAPPISTSQTATSRLLPTRTINSASATVMTAGPVIERQLAFEELPEMVPGPSLVDPYEMVFTRTPQA